jgi:hypothetical protein
MSALELNQKLSNLDADIVQVNEETKTLTQKRSDALSQGEAELAQKIRHQLQELQERLEDLSIMRTAVQGKLRVYKKNSQEAAEIRKKIAGELWPQGAGLVTKMQSALADLTNTIQEMDQLNGMIFGLTAEHEKLIGEAIPVPMISNVIPRDLRRVIGIRLPELPEALEVKVHSQVIREAKEREKATFNERISKQKTLVLPYLESAELTWPKCKTCGRELLCIGASVYEGSQQSIEGHLPELQQKAFRLQFRCEVGPHNGSKGFIQVDRGPYEKVPLTQLEIER